jgi:4-hydroxy-2-oxoheptanedioate aldolase
VNLLKQRIKSGKAAVNGWLAVPSGFTAEVMAQAGWDSLTVDLQHGVQDYHSMVACFQGFQHKPITPMVRVPWNEPGIIGKVLDGGAYGVICPMIESKEDTAAFVSACRYPPVGRRSNGPIRAAVYGAASGYQKTANDEILCLPMIETRGAVDQLEAILDVPGIDGVYVGPSDLSWAFGYQPALDRDEPEILAIYERILKGTAERGLFAAIHCATPSYAVRAIGMGFRLVTVMNDCGLMLNAARAAVQQTRAEAGAIAAD